MFLLGSGTQDSPVGIGNGGGVHKVILSLVFSLFFFLFLVDHRLDRRTLDAMHSTNTQVGQLYSVDQVAGNPTPDGSVIHAQDACDLFDGEKIIARLGMMVRRWWDTPSTRLSRQWPGLFLYNARNYKILSMSWVYLP